MRVNIFGAFWSAAYIDNLLPERMSMFSLLVGTVLMIAIYIWLSSSLLKFEKIESSGIREFIGTGILTLLSFLIWLSLKESLEKFYDDMGLLGFLTPLLIAWVFYKLTSKALLKKKVEPVEIADT